MISKRQLRDVDPKEKDTGVSGSPAGSSTPLPEDPHFQHKLLLPAGDSPPAAPPGSLPTRCPQMPGRGPADTLHEFSRSPTCTPACSVGSPPQPLPRAWSPCPSLWLSPTCSPRTPTRHHGTVPQLSVWPRRAGLCPLCPHQDRPCRWEGSPQPKAELRHRELDFTQSLSGPDRTSREQGPEGGPVLL